MTQENAIAGSPQFMSPEQSLGNHELDLRSDIYSLGAVAYFLLTGQPPFSGASAMELLVAHARDEVLPPSQVVASVPADLEQVVLRSMAKERNARHQSAEDFERALAGCECAAPGRRKRRPCGGARQRPNRDCHRSYLRATASKTNRDPATALTFAKEPDMTLSVQENVRILTDLAGSKARWPTGRSP